MPFTVDDLVGLITSSQVQIEEDCDGSLKLVFNPQNNPGNLSGMKILFPLTDPLNKNGNRPLSPNTILTLSNDIPSYISQYLKIQKRTINAPHYSLSLEFYGGTNKTARFFRKAFADFIQNLDGLHIETRDNIVEITGLIKDVNAMMERLANPAIEQFLTRRAQHHLLSNAPGEGVLVPFFR